MLKLYIARFFPSQSFLTRQFKNHFPVLWKISCIFLCVIIFQLKASPASGMTPGVPVHPMNIHKNARHANGMRYGPAPASENFDEVALTNGVSQGNSPRTIGDWIFSMIDNTGDNDNGAYLDVTNKTNTTHLADDGGDKALGMSGSLNVATAAVIKPSGGAAFSLLSFSIENYFAASANYKVVGYLGGSEKISQDFTAKEYNQTGPYTITLSDAKWSNIDEFRIVRQDGNADVSFYIDDIEIGTPSSTPVPPVINNLDGNKDYFTEGDLPILLDAGSNATVTDGDSPDFNGGNLTASITGNRDPDEDQVGIKVLGPIWLPGGGIVEFNGNPIGTINVGIGTNDFVVNFTTGDATPAAVQALIRALTYYNTDHTDPSTLDRTISITVNDGDGQTSVASKVTVVITGVNDQPTLSTTGGAATFTEGGTAVSLFSGTVINTSESGQAVKEVDLSVSGINDGANEILGIDGADVMLTNGNTGTTTNGLAYHVIVGGGNASINLTSTTGVPPSTMAGILNGLSYANTSGNPTAATRTIKLTSIEDNGGTTNGGIDTKTLSISTTVKVVPVNNPPVITTTSGTTAFTEGNNVPSTPVAVDGGISLSDVDNTTFSSATISITGGFEVDKDVLQFTNDGSTMGDISASSYNTTTGVLTLTSASGATIASWESALRAVSYGNSSENPDANDRTISFTVSDGVASSTSATKTLSVTPVNDAPRVTSNGGGSTANISIAEGNTAITTVKATDADADALGQTISYALSGGTDQSLFSINGTTGALTFKSAPDFDNPSDDGNNNTYEVIVAATDGSATDKQTITVTVTDVNNHTPVITSNGGGSTASVNVAENTTAVTTVKATDADAGTTLTYSLAGGADAAFFKINSATGMLAFTAAPDFEKPSDAGKNNIYEVTVGASDGSHTVKQAITVTVTDVNDNTPLISSNGGGSTASINVVENTTAVTTVKATDADAGTTLTYSLVGGTDQSLFSINGSTGKLTFKTAPDFENPSDADGNGNYEVTVRASDGLHHADQVLTITVTDANDHMPIITSNGGGNTASVNVAENTMAITTVEAIDADAGSTLTYSLAGGADQNLFSIDASTGALVFKTIPDFENPADADGDDHYEVTVRAYDGTNSVDQAITVTVTDVNDNTPVITSNGGSSTATINIAENTMAITTVEATDADAGTTLTYSLAGGADQSLFSINESTGELAFKTAPDFENPSDADGDGNYEVMVQVSDGSHTDFQTITVMVTDENENLNPPVITSNGAGSTATINISENNTAVTTVTATDADAGTTLTYSLAGGTDAAFFKINSATGMLEFKAAPDFEKPSDAGKDNDYEVTVGASDGSHTVKQAITVTVTDINDNTPIITSNDGGSTASINVAENTTAVTAVKATDADAGTTLSYSLAGGTDQGLFSINGSTGALIFKTAPDFENPSDADGNGQYEVAVRASDGLHHVDQTLTITVINENDNPPVITSNGGGSTASVNMAENTTAVTTVKATDADAGTTLAYSLNGGADAAVFKINSATGILAFKTAPDFEKPLDAGKDNAYEVTVGASDGAHTIDQAITVTVTDINDNTPVITSNGGGGMAAITLAENTTAVTTVTAIDADAGTTLTYSLAGGTDQGLFSMNGSTGVLVFKTAPDFENPADADANGNYYVTVRASDGTNTVDQALTVTVTGMNDNAPVITAAQHFSIDENSPVHTLVATVQVKDADGVTTYSDWTITDGNTNDAFAIDANTGAIIVNDSAALDYETTPTFTLKLTVSDGVNTSMAETVTVDLNDVHEAPTGISLAPETLYEDQPAGTPAGKLSATARDAGATFTYSLASGTGDEDNSLFNIAGDTLTTAAPLDYEQKNSYHVRVRATTQYGFYLEKDIIIHIGNLNEAPTLDAIAGQTVCYSAQSQVISLSGISAGEDKGQTTSLTVSADQAGLFKSLTASGNKVQYTLQEGAAGKAMVTVTVKDNGGTANGGVDHLSRSFTLTINPLPVVTITADNANPVSKGIPMHLTAAGADSYQWANSPGIQNGWNDATLMIRPLQDATYAVTGTTAEGCSATQNYDVKIVVDYKLTCNNIVSPNGDGKNDTWIISNLTSYPDNKVMIFDRVGRMVFEKKNYDNQWDGRLNGNLLKEGTYYYVFIVDGGKKIFKGFIEVLSGK